MVGSASDGALAVVLPGTGPLQYRRESVAPCYYLNSVFLNLPNS
jgi:hypothetical protein